MDYISGWCRSQRRLEGLTAIVTGCNTGIGKETALDLYLRGARVIMACRDVSKAEIAKRELESTESKNNKGIILVAKLDLSSLKSVREFATGILNTESQINILVNNAGVMCCPKVGALDLEDINFDKSRYDPVKAYSRSKAANVLYARALARKLKEHNITDVTTYSLHPGVINTEIGRHFSDTVWYGATWVFQNILSWFSKSPRCGAQTTIYCAVDEACEGQSGLYYSECGTTASSRYCQDDNEADKFWELTMELLNLQNYDPFAQDQ